jgi:hypothetical protein
MTDDSNIDRTFQGPADWPERARSTGIATGPDGSFHLERPVEWGTDGIPQDMLTPRADEPEGFHLPWGRRNQ